MLDCESGMRAATLTPIKSVRHVSRFAQSTYSLETLPLGMDSIRLVGRARAKVNRPGSGSDVPRRENSWRFKGRRFADRCNCVTNKRLFFHGVAMSPKRAEHQRIARQAALTANEQAWAERRGEAIVHEYRGRQSGQGGPKTLQLSVMRDRRNARLRPLTEQEESARVMEAGLRWEMILVAHGIK